MLLCITASLLSLTTETRNRMIVIGSIGRRLASLASNSLRTDYITIRDSCFNRLKQILKNSDDEYLRIHVETGGCSGFSYIFEIEPSDRINQQEDLIFARENYRIVINKQVLPFMKGSQIEYHESLIKSSFRVINPIAETKCSCGASFSVDFSKLNR